MESERYNKTEMHIWLYVSDTDAHANRETQTQTYAEAHTQI